MATEIEPAGRTQNTHCDVRNLTPHPLKLVFVGENEGTFRLAPLAMHSLSFQSAEAESAARQRLRSLHDQQVIRIADVAEASDDSAYLGLAFWALVLGLIGGAFLSARYATFAEASWWGMQGKDWLLLGTPAILLLLLLLAYLMAKGKLAPWMRRGSAGLRQMLTLLLVVGVAAALPMAAVTLFARGAPGAPGVQGWQEGIQLLAKGGTTGLGHAIVFTFVCVASALPGLLYFLFDRKRVTQLRENFEQQIFRLDGQVRSLADVQARYGSRLAEIWGSAGPSVSGRLFSGSQWPVVLCTLIVAGGWVVTVLFGAIQSPLPASAGLSDLLKPLNSTYAFAFLGAYYFALRMIARRYARGDLQPKAYSMVTARVLVVLVSAAVASAVFGESPAVWAFLFLVGVLPETFLVALREAAGAHWRRQVQIAEDRLPLTRLEGIDLYDRARLDEEGIANLDNLAHGDLVDLMLNTSIATPQLVEWVDQAMLYLRAHTNPGDADTDVREADRLWHDLRDMGVRRASDLVDKQCRLRQELTELLRARGAPEATHARLRAMVDQLQNDEWFASVLHWRTHDHFEPQEWWIDDAGRASLQASA